MMQSVTCEAADLARKAARAIEQVRNSGDPIVLTRYAQKVLRMAQKELEQAASNLSDECKRKRT